MKRKTIGIDLDDVLLDFNGALCDYHNARYEPKYTWADIGCFELEERWLCSREEARRRIFEFYDTKEHATALPVKGSQEALKILANLHDCIIITSRPDRIKEMTTRWCDQHFPGRFKNIHFTNQFGSEILTRHKGEICQELGVEVFIEDAPYHARHVAEAGIPVLLYDVPWNQNIENHRNMTRVHSWNDIVKHLT